MNDIAGNDKFCLYFWPVFFLFLFSIFSVGLKSCDRQNRIEMQQRSAQFKTCQVSCGSKGVDRFFANSNETKCDCSR